MVRFCAERGGAVQPAVSNSELSPEAAPTSLPRFSAFLVCPASLNRARTCAHAAFWATFRVIAAAARRAEIERARAHRQLFRCFS